MEMYHYRIKIINHEDGKVGYKPERVDGTMTEALPDAVSFAMGKFTDEYLRHRREKTCPKTIDVRLEF